MMTIEGAYAVKQEDYIGSLEVGKYADLIVIDDDPLTTNPDNIKDINVLLTMIDGKIEFQWASHTFPTPYTNGTSRTISTIWVPILALAGLMIVMYIKRK